MVRTLHFIGAKMNVNKIIHLALKQLGVLATGESATADDVADGVDCLGLLLAQWATDKLHIFKVERKTIQLNGQKQFIDNIAKIADTATLNGREITLVRDSDLHYFPKSQGVIFGHDGSGWWVQGSGELVLNCYVLPTDFNVGDDLAMPDYYERALILSLALDVAPMYGVEPSVSLLKNHAQAMTLLKRANSTPYMVKNDLPVGLGGGCSELFK